MHFRHPSEEAHPPELRVGRSRIHQQSITVLSLTFFIIRARRTHEATLYGCHARPARKYAIVTSTWYVLPGYESFGCEGGETFSCDFFQRQHSGPLQVYGTLTITSAASEADVTHYHVYYGSSDFAFKHFLIFYFPCLFHISARYQ